MFDPEEAARLILSKSKKKGDDDAPPSGRDAFKAAWKAMQDGDEETAYDAFRAAVSAAGSEETEGE